MIITPKWFNVEREFQFILPFLNFLSTFQQQILLETKNILVLFEMSEFFCATYTCFVYETSKTINFKSINHF